MNEYKLCEFCTISLTIVGRVSLKVRELLVNSKVIASCYVSHGGQESHQRIRKCRDGHGLENPTDVKKKGFFVILYAKRIQK